MFRVLNRLIGTTLVFGLSACSLFTPPKDLDIKQTRPSNNGKYIVSMRPLSEPVRVNQIHSWEISISTPAGAPVKKAQIAFEGAMPQHFHSMPTQPRVTAELDDGRYRLDGVKFSMTGWWTMTTKIQAELGNDQATINTVLTNSGIAKTSADLQ